MFYGQGGSHATRSIRYMHIIHISIDVLSMYVHNVSVYENIYFWTYQHIGMGDMCKGCAQLFSRNLACECYLYNRHRFIDEAAKHLDPFNPTRMNKFCWCIMEKFC